MKNTIIIFTLLMLLTPIITLGAETITGYACYRYSDNESINSARDIALSMAKREALEKYQVFVASTSTVENSVLMNDLISSLTAGVLKNLRITKKTEDLGKKEVCREITAEVEPIEIKQRIVSKINVYRQKQSNFQSGLPENNKLKVLKVVDKGGGSLKIVAKCKKTEASDTQLRSYMYDKYYLRVISYDEDGIPTKMDKRGFLCYAVGDLVVFDLKYFTPDYSFELVN
jgi:hypothetical protein